VTSLPVAPPPQMWLCPSPYTTNLTTPIEKIPISIARDVLGSSVIPVILHQYTGW